MISYLILISCLVCFFIIYYFIRQTSYVIKHKDYIATMEYFLEESYEMIYKDQILSYTASGYKPGPEELETIKRNFVKLSRSIMGTNIERCMINFFGDEVVLTNNILMFLQNRMDNDELVKIAKRNQNDTTVEEG